MVPVVTPAVVVVSASVVERVPRRLILLEPALAMVRMMMMGHRRPSVLVVSFCRLATASVGVLLLLSWTAYRHSPAAQKNCCHLTALCLCLCLRPPRHQSCCYHYHYCYFHRRRLCCCCCCCCRHLWYHFGFPPHSRPHEAARGAEAGPPPPLLLRFHHSSFSTIPFLHLCALLL